MLEVVDPVESSSSMSRSLPSYTELSGIQKGSLREVLWDVHENSLPFDPVSGKVEESTGRSFEDTSLRQSLHEGVEEVIDELNHSTVTISEYSLEHVHEGEILLVHGFSSTVNSFLGFAAKKRRFKVFVAEGRGSSGHRMALTLAKKGVETVLIRDAAVFGVMGKVNKVIIGAHAIMADGGVLGASGTDMVTSSAVYFRVPIVCVTGLFKLSPYYPHNQDSFNELESPGTVFPYAKIPREVRVLNPVYDYVPPSKIDLFVTNRGGHPPGYMNRHLSEMYSIHDLLTEGFRMLR